MDDAAVPSSSVSLGFLFCFVGCFAFCSNSKDLLRDHFCVTEIQYCTCEKWQKPGIQCPKQAYVTVVLSPQAASFEAVSSVFLTVETTVFTWQKETGRVVLLLGKKQPAVSHAFLVCLS